MKQSEKNFALLENFAIYHSGSNEALYEELLQSITDYIEEDHVDGKPADEERQMRVYVVDIECFDEGTKELFDNNKCSDQTFMQLAKEQFSIYTIPEFQKAFNEGEIYIDSDFMFVRYIEWGIY